MKGIIKSKTIETDYFGILSFIFGGAPFVFWYVWLGGVLKKNGCPKLGAFGEILGVVLGLSFLIFLLPGLVTFTPTGSNRMEVVILVIGYFVLAGYFVWNEVFRQMWNQIASIRDQSSFKAAILWTIVLGPIYLNFKINQAKGIEK